MTPALRFTLRATTSASRLARRSTRGPPPPITIGGPPGVTGRERRRIRRSRLDIRCKAFAPDAVIGVGGYASGPVVLMARLAGIPTAICEQNSIPGLTNKILGRFARRVFLAFEESRRFFKPRKVLLSGNPVRRTLLTALSSEGVIHQGVIHPGPRRIFVCGGSQGASKVNELASQAIISLADPGVTVVHQTGAKDVDAIREAYAKAGVSAEVHAFIQEMAKEYLQADVIVSRAGATTVAELAIAGKPAIFIPYPFAADNHQEINAREMADAGAALMFRQAELTPDILAKSLRELLDDDVRRARMGSVMKSLAKPDAAATVVDWCQAEASARKR